MSPVPTEPPVAPPSAAPPTPAATLAPPTPASATSRPAAPGKYYVLYRVAPRGSQAGSGQRGRVSFWNLTGRDVVLRVGGRTQSIARGKRVSLDLERTFEWQVDGRAAEKATIRDGDVGLEVVLRK